NHRDTLCAVGATANQFKSFVFTQERYETLEDYWVVICNDKPTGRHFKSLPSLGVKPYAGNSIESSAPCGELDRLSDPPISTILFLIDTGPMFRVASSVIL